MPRYERAACPVEIAPGERVDCGVLVVPEHRGLACTLAIRLPVVIFRESIGVSRTGPGALHVGRARQQHGGGAEIRQGTCRFSTIGTTSCSSSGCAARASVARLPGDQRTHGRRSPPGGCEGPRQRRRSPGPPRRAGTGLTSRRGRSRRMTTAPRRLTTSKTCGRRCGFETWNLQGISYSTRLMLTVARRHPAGVRSVILDSVLPPEVNFDECRRPISSAR
ncbi:MAG: alpha/beta hydrolase [Desulfobacterales bacterium]|nr:alpha/beta hydrolase [Desulfobacterales bacterium]